MGEEDIRDKRFKWGVKQTWKPARGGGGGESTETKMKAIKKIIITKEFEHRYPEFVINVPETSIIKLNSQRLYRILPYVLLVRETQAPSQIIQVLHIALGCLPEPDVKLFCQKHNTLSLQDLEKSSCN